MTDSERHLRELVIHTCRRLHALGLNQGTSGNISVRCDPRAPEQGFWLTPTSLDYDRMEAEDIVHVDLDGRCTGRSRPSSELPFHHAIMRARPDTHAIIHTHSEHATAVSCLRHDIPALHYLIALFGGPTIRCAEYATFGTAELSANILRALEDRRGALLANHGLIVLGTSLEHALTLTAEAEILAKLYLRCLAAGGPVILPDEEITRVIDRIRNGGYGSEAAVATRATP